MTPSRHRKRDTIRTRPWRLVRRLAALPLLILFLWASGAAWAYWSVGSVAGSSGTSAAGIVNAGPIPTASISGSSVTVSWAASKLSNGTAVSGYTLKRYNSAGTTAQSMSSCSARITSTSCTETAVPDGSWTYKITPVFQTNWTGVESAASAVIVVDRTPPSGGSVTISGLTGTGNNYSRTTSLSLVLNPGTDANGIAAGAQLWRATATLTSTGGADGVCGALSTYSLVATGPSSPTTNDAPDQKCVSYQYLVSDTHGNSATYTSATAKIDTTAPTNPTLILTGATATNTWWNGSTVFYRSNAATGSFTATATASDTASGVKTFAFTSPGTNWTSSAGTTSGVNTYSWSSTPGGTGASVTATNNAGGQSGSTAFTLVADNTAPTGSSVTPPSGSSSSTTASVSFTTGTDASGINTRLLQRASVAQANGVCPTSGYSTFTTIFTNPGSSPVSDTVKVGNCYKYQYVVSDNVGNTATASSGNVLRVGSSYYATVSATNGLVSYWRLADATFANSVTTGQPGTFSGSPTFVTGAIAGDAAADFGSSAYGSASHDLTANFSIELWMKSNSASGSGCTTRSDGPALASTSSNGNHLEVGVSLCGGKIIAGSNTNQASANIVSPTASYNDGSWHYIVFTRIANGTIALYLDGAFIASSTGGPNNTPSTSKLNIAGTSGNSFVGTLDEIAVYDFALDQAAVSAHYAAR
ncbi:LamG domain-containing protein [Cryobacterium sp. PH29-G1]|uniref:LamG domain-containing protein n=1 Tax=Cryobacterium sp. PH29-G1 TaxID=3046211 RepID=UPI0024BA672C|nr:LamG domain-containing protein [Cryobacterium sp. PH29-G1]MDJ0347941.1 LamG domain-containing protein [Cryobacterium sp. PH29-G1]